MNNEPLRLQKYFSDCGLLSRRAAEDEIKRGKVKVNGVVASLGDKIIPGVDVVEYEGKEIKPSTQKKVYLMLNKPRGYVTTLSDEKDRHVVTELISECKERVYPIGRLDMDSEGLLLFTNDGDLTNKLTHPSNEHIPKVYEVIIKEKVTTEVLTTLSSPMKIDGYKIKPVDIHKLAQNAIQFTLYEGRNRQIRKMCEQAHVTVLSLVRVSVGDLPLGNLPLGEWRYLTNSEINYLKKQK